MKSYPLVIFGLLISANLFAQHLSVSLAGATVPMWPSSQIEVCWENPSQKYAREMDLVQQSIKESWEKESAIKFIGWNKCTENSQGVRILISDEHPRIDLGGGVVIDGIKNGMILNFDFLKWSVSGFDCKGKDKDLCIKSIAIHEFGHTLGFMHENDRDDRINCSSGNAINPNLFWKITKYDPMSVMNYCAPGYMGNGNLSPLDIEAVRQLYGSPNGGEKKWILKSGKAKDIGIGANGEVWVIGQDPVGVRGDYSIYKWSGKEWQNIAGGGIRIAVDNYGNPWVVNASGEIFQRKSGKWNQLPGKAKDIGIGANGAVWVIGNNPVGVKGDYSIHKWTGKVWQTIPGGGIRIAVDPSGNPWVVNASGEIFQLQANNWKLIAGSAKDIGISQGGTVWIISNNAVGKVNYKIMNLINGKWNEVDGFAAHIAVAPNGLPWVVNAEGLIWERK